MAEFLTTKGISYQIENILMEAKTELVLVSPFLQLSKTFYERLRDASNRKVSITVIYGKEDLKPNEKNSLAELKNVTLFYSENLHAKCYFNESKMVITSMNMYEFSEINNREMGVLITKENDVELFNKAITETQSIISSGEQIKLNKTNRNFGNRIELTQIQAKGLVKSNVPGYCIRCEDRIDFSTDKPLCYSCYLTWAQFENPHYPENVCHRCGEYADVSVSKPVCYDCFKRA